MHCAYGPHLDLLRYSRARGPTGAGSTVEDKNRVPSTLPKIRRAKLSAKAAASRRAERTDRPISRAAWGLTAKF